MTSVDQQRRADHVVDDSGHDLDRMILGADFDVPDFRTARPGQLQTVSVEPHHEDLGLNRPADIPCILETRHHQHAIGPTVDAEAATTNC